MNPNVNLFKFNRFPQWLKQRQMHVLEEAYQGALEIKALEEQYFEGGKIGHTSEQSKVVYDYVCSLRDRQLLRVRSNLTQLRINSFLLNRQGLEQPMKREVFLESSEKDSSQNGRAVAVVEKLDLIDKVISKYRQSWEQELEFPDDHIPAPNEVNASPTAKDSPISGKDRVAKLLDPVIVQLNTNSTDKSHQQFWRKGFSNGYKNILADGVALSVFAVLVYFNRGQLSTLRSFSNRTFLGLSDPAKVFLFILITDMFVGFHSAEGWEVILEGTVRHFGLPESKTAIYLFIATVPVVADSCIKFWIFSYLTRYSPSASAIYERMNT